MKLLMTKFKLTRQLNWLSLAMCCLTANASAQIKLEPLPLLNQCASLSAGATAAKALQPALAALQTKGQAKETALRVKAAQDLGKSCHQQAAAPLVAALQDAEPSLRVAAVRALGQLGDKETIHDLRMIMDDSDWRVRLALVQALASFKTFSARNSVLNGIANPNDAEIGDADDLRVRCVAILTLNQLNDTSYSLKAVFFVRGFLLNPQAHVREIAEQTMFALKETANAPIELTAILKSHNNAELRRWAAVWLGKLRIERGRDVLTEAAANDASLAVKQAAAEALALLK